MMGLPDTLTEYPRIPESTVKGWHRNPPLELVTGEQFQAGASRPQTALRTEMEEALRRRLAYAREGGAETTRDWIMSVALEFATNKRIYSV
jgi:hypothetical protein